MRSPRALLIFTLLSGVLVQTKSVSAAQSFDSAEMTKKVAPAVVLNQ